MHEGGVEPEAAHFLALAALAPLAAVQAGQHVAANLNTRTKHRTVQYSAAQHRTAQHQGKKMAKRGAD